MGPYIPLSISSSIPPQVPPHGLQIGLLILLQGRRKLPRGRVMWSKLKAGFGCEEAISGCLLRPFWGLLRLQRGCFRPLRGKLANSVDGSGCSVSGSKASFISPALSFYIRIPRFPRFWKSSLQIDRQIDRQAQTDLLIEMHGCISRGLGERKKEVGMIQLMPLLMKLKGPGYLFC